MSEGKCNWFNWVIILLLLLNTFLLAGLWCKTSKCSAASSKYCPTEHKGMMNAGEESHKMCPIKGMPADVQAPAAAQ